VEAASARTFAGTGRLISTVVPEPGDELRCSSPPACATTPSAVASPSPTVRPPRPGREERLEGAGQDLRRHALPVVGDADRGGVAGPAGGHGDRAAVRHGVARVVHEGVQQAVQQARVDHHRGPVAAAQVECLLKNYRHQWRPKVIFRLYDYLSG
jgi:hypothetical protein